MNENVNNFINMITIKQFQQAMKTVKEYCSQIQEREMPKSESEIGCRVRLSEWGQQMQGRSNKIGTVVDYLPGVYRNDGTVWVKWDDIRIPVAMHLHHIVTIKK